LRESSQLNIYIYIQEQESYPLTDSTGHLEAAANPTTDYLIIDSTGHLEAAIDPTAKTNSEAVADPTTETMIESTIDLVTDLATIGRITNPSTVEKHSAPTITDSALIVIVFTTDPIKTTSKTS
jgi:hypothetical protein